MSTPVENEIREFKENDEIVFKIWSNGAWHDVNVSAGAVSGGVTPGSREFLESDIFTVPAGVTQVKVTLVAGGGGGGQGYHGIKAVAGSGGGAGEYVENAMVPVTPGQNIMVTIGEGGMGRKWPLYNMQHAECGGDSSFGPYLKVKGGFRGAQGSQGGNGGSGNGDFTAGPKNSNGLNSISHAGPYTGTTYTGAGGGGAANADQASHGGNGGNDTHRSTIGGAHGTAVGTYYGSGGGGAAGWGGNGGAGGNRTATTATGQVRLAEYDGQDALGYGAGGGGGANNGEDPYYNYGYGGNGYQGYCKVEWS